MSITQEIKNIGKEVGLDIVRVTSAEAFPHAQKSIIESIEKGYIPELEYHSNKRNESLESNEIRFNRIAKRCNPKNILKNAKSIITVAYNYLMKEEKTILKAFSPVEKLPDMILRIFILK